MEKNEIFIGNYCFGINDKGLLGIGVKASFGRIKDWKDLADQEAKTMHELLSQYLLTKGLVSPPPTPQPVVVPAAQPAPTVTPSVQQTRTVQPQHVVEHVEEDDFPDLEEEQESVQEPTDLAKILLENSEQTVRVSKDNDRLLREVYKVLRTMQKDMKK
jgi:hypothetical protein